MSTQPILPQRDIQYCSETRDYALFLDGAFIGFATTYHAGETALDALVYKQLQAQPVDEAYALALELADEYEINLDDALTIATHKLDAVLSYAALYDEWVAMFSAAQAA